MKVVFVGGFQKVGKSGHVGGQAFACVTLIESPWGKEIDWILVDTMSETNMDRGFIFRLKLAYSRYLEFRKAIKSPGVDVALIFCSSGFSFLEKGLLVLTARRHNIPAVLAPRSGLIHHNLNGSRFYRWFVSNVTSKSDRVICQSEYWRDLYKQYGGGTDEKYPVIHNWLDAKPYNEIGGNRRYENTQTIKVLFLGWVNINKGIFDLLEAAALVKDLDIQFIIGGNGTHFEEAQKFVKENQLEQTVDLRSWIKGQAKLDVLAEADVFVLPSYLEGYPNALLESMAAGLCCIATRITSVPDLIDHGVNGWIVDPGDSAGLADQLKYIYENPEARINSAKAGREKVLENNRLEKATDKLQTVFSDLTK